MAIIFKTLNLFNRENSKLDFDISRLLIIFEYDLKMIAISVYFR